MKESEGGTWWLQYDGTSDKSKSPIHNAMVCNPKPLLLVCGGQTKKGPYLALDHAQEIKGNMDYLKGINGTIIVGGVMSDNEPTMKSTKKQLLEEGAVDDIGGCACHAFHLHTGIIFNTTTTTSILSILIVSYTITIIYNINI